MKQTNLFLYIARLLIFHTCFYKKSDLSAGLRDADWFCYL